MSASNRACVREELDRYYTPDPCAEACVRALSEFYFGHPGKILEPHVGGGAFARAARKQWPNSQVDVMDLDPAAPGLHESQGYTLNTDFLKLREDSPKYDLILGNPPFKNAMAHLLNAFRHVEEHGLIAFLLSSHFWEAKARCELPLPAIKWWLAPRPRFTGRGDSSPYLFAVWRARSIFLPQELGKFGRVTWTPKRATRRVKTLECTLGTSPQILR